VCFSFHFSLQKGTLCRLLPAPLDDTAELVNSDVLADLGLLGLVFGVLGDLNDTALNLPAASLGDELGDLLLAVKTQPPLEDAYADLAEGLADELGDADANDLLETLDVSGEIGVDVVGVVVEGGPELSVVCARAGR
jgi:hypothetical protein